MLCTCRLDGLFVEHTFQLNAYIIQLFLTTQDLGSPTN